MNVRFLVDNVGGWFLHGELWRRLKKAALSMDQERRGWPRRSGGAGMAEGNKDE